VKTPVAISIERLRARLSYCAETGALTWKERVSEPGVRTRNVNAWNTRYAGKPAFGYVDAAGYGRGSFEGQMLLAHRVLWALHHGRWPSEFLDHINGDPADNRLVNLREVDATGNQQNLRLRRSSQTGVTGVSRHSGCDKFVAQINERGRHHYLGIYPTIAAAAAARKEAEREYGFHPNHGRAAA
jgi:hypothetical protein